MIEAILERATRAGAAAEVVYAESESAPVVYENDKLRSIRMSQSSSIALRVIADGRQGSSFTNDMADTEGLVERALENARYGAPATFVFPGPSEGPKVQIFDPEIRAITREEMVTTGGEMLERVKSAQPDVLVDCGASTSWGRAVLANSSGAHMVEEGTHYSVWAHGQRIRGTDILMAGHGRSWRARAGIDPVAVAHRAIEKFRLAEHEARIDTGEYPVLFRPGATGILLAPLRLGVNGRNVFKVDSPIAARLGEQIVDERITISDDPLVDFAGSSSRWDSEGVPRRQMTVFEAGVLRAFLYDLDTAAKAGTESTGNGVGCGFSNLIMAPGDVPYAEMVRGMKEGLIIDGVIGAGQSNVMNGDFSVNIALGYKVENGEIVGRVKNAMVAGNAYKALNGLAAIASDPEWVSSSTRVPALLVGRLSVVSKE